MKNKIVENQGNLPVAGRGMEKFLERDLCQDTFSIFQCIVIAREACPMLEHVKVFGILCSHIKIH